MMTTKNYKFKKPELTDSPPDITVLNGNFDTIDEKLFKVIQAWEDFKANGGVINGPIKGVSGTTGHRFLEHIGVFNGRNALLRTSTANMNGYPAIINMIEDIDTPDNGNGFVFVLGNGKDGDTYRNSFLRPIYQAYGAGSVNLGSPSVPWDDLWLGAYSKGGNGYTKLPNGLILQWGSFYVTEGLKRNVWTKFSVSYPIQFPNNVLNIMVAPNGHSRGSARGLKVELGDFPHPNPNFDVWVLTENSNWGGAMWMAIGY